MDIKILATVFFTVLVADSGAETRLVTVLFAADKDVSNWTAGAGFLAIAIGLCTLARA